MPVLCPVASRVPAHQCTIVMEESIGNGVGSHCTSMYNSHGRVYWRGHILRVQHERIHDGEVEKVPHQVLPLLLRLSAGRDLVPEIDASHVLVVVCYSRRLKDNNAIPPSDVNDNAADVLVCWQCSNSSLVVPHCQQQVSRLARQQFARYLQLHLLHVSWQFLPVHLHRPTSMVSCKSLNQRHRGEEVVEVDTVATSEVRPRQVDDNTVATSEVRPRQVDDNTVATSEVRPRQVDDNTVATSEVRPRQVDDNTMAESTFTNLLLCPGVHLECTAVPVGCVTALPHLHSPFGGLASHTVWGL